MGKPRMAGHSRGRPIYRGGVPGIPSPGSEGMGLSCRVRSGAGKPPGAIVPLDELWAFSTRSADGLPELCLAESRTPRLPRALAGLNVIHFQRTDGATRARRFAPQEQNSRFTPSVMDSERSVNAAPCHRRAAAPGLCFQRSRAEILPGPVRPTPPFGALTVERRTARPCPAQSPELNVSSGCFFGHRQDRRSPPQPAIDPARCKHQWPDPGNAVRHQRRLQSGRNHELITGDY